MSVASAPDGTGKPRQRSGARSRSLARAKSPLAKPIKRADTIWIEPRFEADIAYTEITDDGMVRHPSFKGLHEEFQAMNRRRLER
jgi:bifunctional non-homologous end joining protein LigD